LGLEQLESKLLLTCVAYDDFLTITENETDGNGFFLGNVITGTGFGSTPENSDPFLSYVVTELIYHSDTGPVSIPANTINTFLSSGAVVGMLDHGQFSYSTSFNFDYLSTGQTVEERFTYTLSAYDLDDQFVCSTTADITVTILGEDEPTVSLSGLVYLDVNANGDVDLADQPIPGVTIELLNSGGQVIDSTQTDVDGVYLFADLAPGTYAVRELQPTGVNDGPESAGNLGGDATSLNDQISGIVLAGVSGENYNFAEHGQGIAGGDTATIGFWQNKNGQRLINTVSVGTQLGDWLATEFPNMFGDLAGKPNSDVAAEYKELFKMKRQKLDAQVMATALAVYATSEYLSGTTVAAGYGFTVTDTGISTKLFNVGNSGEAFGVADYTALTILQLLKETDDRTGVTSGVLYDLDDDGVIDTGLLDEALLRTLANDVYSALNEGGDI